MTDTTKEHIRRKANTVCVTFGKGYAPHVIGKTMVKVKNTGNGYIAKFPSYSICDQDNIICLDYSEAHVLWLALGEFFKDGQP